MSYEISKAIEHYLLAVKYLSPEIADRFLDRACELIATKRVAA